MDFDSIIEVKLKMINSHKEMNFLLPSLFLEFQKEPLMNRT